MSEWLHVGGPPALAFLAALLVDHRMARRGLLPPAFAFDRPDVAPGWALLRRGAAGSSLALALWLGVFLPLGSLGQEVEIDVTALEPTQLFLLHGIFSVTLGAWLLLAFGPAPRRWGREIGLRARRVARELALGTAAGVVAWALVIVILVLVGFVLWRLAGEELLPAEPPAMVPWLVGLPVALRLAVSVSAGVVEEVFFRGFLQPRVGVALSSVLFVLAHLSYEQPLMLVGIAVLSLLFAFLVRWRQSVWAAIAAHAVFDGVQLLLVIPWAMRLVGPENVAAGVAAIGG